MWSAFSRHTRAHARAWVHASPLPRTHARAHTLSLTFTHSHTHTHTHTFAYTHVHTHTSRQPFGEVATLAPSDKSTVNLYVDFGGKTRAAKFDIVTDKVGSRVSVGCRVPMALRTVVGPPISSLMRYVAP